MEHVFDPMEVSTVNCEQPKTMTEDVEGFEWCLSSEQIGSWLYVEKAARTGNAPFFNGIDVMTVLPTGFRKCRP